MGRKSRRKRIRREFKKQHENYINKVIYDWFLKEEDIDLLELTLTERSNLLNNYTAEVDEEGSITSIQKIEEQSKGNESDD